MFYSLFVFRISYKIIVLSSLNLAGRLPVFGPPVWAGYGPETCGPGRAWTKHSMSGSGLGLNSSLRGWAGLKQLLRAWAGPGL